MIAGPPYNSPLRRALRQKGHHKGKHSACLVGPVRKIAVVTTSHSEHSNQVQCDASNDGGSSWGDKPSCAQKDDVEQNEAKFKEKSGQFLLL